MSQKVSKIIIESSIVFVSIFSTLGLLYGAVSNDFKSNYYYLGYMLYYSLPFILACFMGVVYFLTLKNNRKLAEAISDAEVAFFITGLMMIIWLATSAAGTMMLPASYVFFPLPFNLAILEFVVFITLLLLISLSSQVVEFEFSKNKSKTLDGIRNNRLVKHAMRWRLAKSINRTIKRTDFRALFALSMISIFFLGIMFMAAFGVTQKTSVKYGSASLQLSQSLNLTASCSLNMNFDQADKISININSEQNRYFTYVFLDQTNYAIYINQSLTNLSPNIIKQDFGTSTRFDTVINETKSYNLLICGNSAEGTNITYSISVTKADASNQYTYFGISFFSIGGFLFVARVRISKGRVNSYRSIV
jgi:hypothetical protein